MSFIKENQIYYWPVMQAGIESGFNLAEAATLEC